MAAAPAALLGLAAVASLAAPAAAQFRYIPPDTPRPGFSSPASDDPLSLGQTLRRLAGPEVSVRFDRRVDTARRVARSYGTWRSLVFAEGLAAAVHDDEIHFRPAGLPAADTELVTQASGRADWRVHDGETLLQILERWTGRASVRLLPLTDRSWRLEGDHIWPRMTFAQAVAALMFAMSHLPRPPAADLDGGTLVLSHRAPAADPPPRRGPWTLAKGDTLRQTLERWAEIAGHKVIFETRRTYRLTADRTFQGLTAVEASDALVKALGHLPRPPTLRDIGGVLHVGEAPPAPAAK